LREKRGSHRDTEAGTAITIDVGVLHHPLLNADPKTPRAPRQESGEERLLPLMGRFRVCRSVSVRG
jgi:hypothetical protein